MSDTNTTANTYTVLNDPNNAYIPTAKKILDEEIDTNRVLNNEKTGSSGAVREFAYSTKQFVEETTKGEDNNVQLGYKKLQTAADIMSIAAPNAHIDFQGMAVNLAYNTTNFERDPEARDYFNKIGYATKQNSLEDTGVIRSDSNGNTFVHAKLDDGSKVYLSNGVKPAENMGKVIDISKYTGSYTVIDGKGNDTGFSGDKLLNTYKDSASEKGSIYANQGSFYSASGTVGKAYALEDIQNAGYSHLQNNTELKNILGNARSSEDRLKEISSAKSQLEEKLKNAMAMGDSAREGSIRDALKELTDCERYCHMNVSTGFHDGKFTDKGYRGIRTLANITGFSSSDVGSQVMATANTVHNTRKVVKNAINVSNKIRRNINTANINTARKNLEYQKLHGSTKDIDEARNRLDRLYTKKKDIERSMNKPRNKMERGRGAQILKEDRQREYLERLKKSRGSHQANKKELRDLANEETQKILKYKSEYQDRLTNIQSQNKKITAKDKRRVKKEVYSKERRENLRNIRKQQRNLKKTVEKDARNVKRLNKIEQKARNKAFAKSAAKKASKSAAKKAANKAIAEIAKLSARLADLALKAAQLTADITRIIADGEWMVYVGILCVAVICIEVAVLWFGSLTVTSVIFSDNSQVVADLDGIVHPDLSEVNFNQYILDKTAYEMGTTFVTVAGNDAKMHYLIDDNKNKLWSSARGGDNYSIDEKNLEDARKRDSSIHYNWYKALDSSSIGAIWAREEADNTTMFTNADGTQSLAFADTYVDADHRTDLGSININYLPTLAMANYRMVDPVSQYNFRNAEAYMYYMFIASHNKSVYDDKNGDGDTNDKDESPYVLTVGDNHDDSQILSKRIVWVTANKTTNISREEALRGGEDGCSNVFFHGYNGQERFSLTGTVIVNGKEAVNSVASYLNPKVSNFNTCGTPIGTELVWKTSNGGLKFSGNYADEKTILSRDSEVDGDLKHDTGSAFTYQEGGTTYIGCTHLYSDKGGKNFFQWSNNEDDYLNCQYYPFNGYTPKLLKRGEDPSYENKSGKLSNGTASSGNSYCDSSTSTGYTWYATTCGHLEHTHTSDASGECNRDLCDEVGDNDTREETVEKEGHKYEGGSIVSCTYHTTIEVPCHTHCPDCCSYQEHTHDSWHSIDDPGCWTSIGVCQGHCGGHLSAKVNVVVMNSWEGLMGLDNFKMTYFLRDSSFEGSVLEHNFWNLDIWMAYWNIRINTWFSPYIQGFSLLSNPVDAILYVDNGDAKNDLDSVKKNAKNAIESTKIYTFFTDNIGKQTDGSTDEVNALMAETDDLFDNDDSGLENHPTINDTIPGNTMGEVHYGDQGNYDNDAELYRAFTGWYSDGSKTTKVYTDPDTHKSYSVTKQTEPGYENAVTMMRSLYGDSDNKWEAGRNAFVGLKFPMGNYAENPGSISQLKGKARKEALEKLYQDIGGF